MAVYELSHDYDEDEIFEIQYSQINDVVNLAHSNHTPKKLTRLAANNWTLTDLNFVGGPFFTDNAILSGSTVLLMTSATITPSATAGTVTLSASANLFTVSGSTLGHKNTYWKIGSTVTNSTTGLAEQGYVKITTVTNPSTATATVMKTLSTGSATTLWAQGSWSDVLGWPARTTFYQQRLVFARTTYQPQNVWCSKSFQFENFALDGGEDDDAIDVQLASNESNDIKWLVAEKTLIAGTYGGEFIISSGDGGPLTPSNTNVSKETSWGSEDVVPKKIGSFFYYIQRFSRKLREFFFNFDLNSYKSSDRTILSPHIADDGFIDIAYQQNPDTILWCVTSQGNIATMTREVDQELTGWSRQTTQGNYESIATIPSQSEPNDEVWVVAKRTLGDGSERRYIERFKSQLVPERKDQCFYVHSGLTYDAYALTAASTATTISLSATSGTIVATASQAYFASNDVGQRIRAIDSEGATVGELLVTGYTSSTILVGEVKYTFNATGYTGGLWGVSVSSVSGLDHLEGLDVVVLADGGLDKPDKTVSSGTISLAYDYFVVNAGLPYTQKIKTLPQEVGSERGTAQGKIQRINQVAFKVNRSHTGFKYGEDEDALDKVQFRNAGTLMGTPEDLYTGTIPNLSYMGDYTYGPQMWIQNSDPLPIELLSIITTITTEDK
jgi:hypothetical protein